jgi:CBS domain containing-hemolysin-like protein
MEAMIEAKRMGSKTLKRVHKSINKSVITIVVFNNIVNIVGSIIVGQLVIKMYGDAVLAVITTALTFGIIVFSEILPKSLGIHYAEKVSLLSAPIILLLTLITYPLITGLEWATNLLKSGERKVGTEAQIRSLVTIGRREGHIETDEGQLIHRAFILNDKRARDIMTPLKDVIGVQHSMTVQEASEKVLPIPHSRFPVFGDAINDVEGLVLKQDILESIKDGEGDQAITSIMRDALVVPGWKRSDGLIAIFRDEHKHLAVVQDDKHTIGVVTLEDVLEELVGDIEDETDSEENNK